MNQGVTEVTDCLSLLYKFRWANASLAPLGPPPPPRHLAYDHTPHMTEKIYWAAILKLS